MLLFWCWGNDECKLHLCVFWTAIGATLDGIGLWCIKHDYLLLDFARNDVYDWLAGNLDRMNHIHTGSNQCDGTVLRYGDDCWCIAGLADIKKPFFGDQAQNIVLRSCRDQAELAKFALIEPHWIDGACRGGCPCELYGKCSQ